MCLKSWPSRPARRSSVKNSDPVLHNVHGVPAAGSGNKEFNQAQLQGSPDLSFAFDKPEMFLKFKCDVHPWMFAWVSVFDHPYFAVSAKDGTFKIANVPPGKYKIQAAHRKAGTVTQEIEVKEGEARQSRLYSGSQVTATSCHAPVRLPP